MRSRVATAVGVAALVAGGFVAARTGWWLVADLGLTGTGSVPEDRLAIVFPFAAAVFVVLLGVVVLLGRRQRAGGRTLLLAVTVGAVAFSPLVLAVYPQPEPAILTAHDAETGEILWRVDLPVNHVFGYRSLDDGRLELEGRKDRRDCDWKLRSVTLDAVTGEVLDEHDLPTFHPDPESVPPPARPLEEVPFVVEQGSAPFSCSS